MRRGSPPAGALRHSDPTPRALASRDATLASASSTSTTQTTIRLVAVDLPKSERFVDAAPKGTSPGDTLFFRETLLENGKKAGGSEVMCVFVGRNARRCHGTLRLGGGTLEASGGTRFGGRFSLPVVGGAHAGAAGVLTVVAVSEKRSRYIVELAR